MSAVLVTRTYLEMRAPEELKPAAPPVPAPVIRRLPDCSIELFRRLYAEVGRAFRWTDRLAWSDEAIRRHLDDPTVSMWVVTWETEPAGYFELKEHTDSSVEIAYFGLMPDYIGRGWGKYLLTYAVQAAWGMAPQRVWLHTCTLDHPAALPNYLKRGFHRLREERYTVSGEVGRRGSG